MQRYVYILFFTILLSACQASKDYINDTILKVSLYSFPQNWDPSQVSDRYSSQVLINIFEPLVKENPINQQIEANLAEKWTISDDEKTYTFYLRKDALWSDGVAITSSDVLFSLLRVLDLKTASALREQIAGIFQGGSAWLENTQDPFPGITIINDKVFQFHLSRPIDNFLSAFLYSVFLPLPSHVIKKNKDAWINENLVSSGAYRLKEYRINDYIRLEKNPLYWEAEKVYFDTLIFYISNNENTLWNMYQNKEIDVIANLYSPEIWKHIQNDSGFQISNAFSMTFININLNHKVLNQKKIRQALYLSINRKELIDKVFNKLMIHNASFIPYGSSNYDKVRNQTEENSFQPAYAQKLLAEANYPNGKNFPLLKYTYNQNQLNQLVAEYLQNQWKKHLNISIELVAKGFKDYISDMRYQNFDLIRQAWTAWYPSPYIFLEFFMHENPMNIGSYNYLPFEQLMKELKYSQSNTEKIEKEAHQILLNSLPALPLFQQRTIGLISDSIGGVKINSSSIILWKEAYRR